MELIREVEQRQSEVVRLETQHRQLSETLQVANTAVATTAATSDAQEQALMQVFTMSRHLK